MKLKGAHAVVTGASSGIGGATATLLAARGAHVVLIARDRIRLEAVAAQIGESGASAEVYAGDLADGATVASIARTILDTPAVVLQFAQPEGLHQWRHVHAEAAPEPLLEAVPATDRVLRRTAPRLDCAVLGQLLLIGTAKVHLLAMGPEHGVKVSDAARVIVEHGLGDHLHVAGDA